MFGGTADAWAPPEAMARWSGETRGNFRERYFPGGHFYFLGTAFAGFARTLVTEVGDVAEANDVAEVNDLARQVSAAGRLH